MVIIIRCSVLFTHSHTLFIRCMCNTEGWHTHSSLEKYILCKEWWYYLSSFKSIADRTILKNILSFQQEITQLVNGKLFSQGGKYTIAKSEFLLEKEWLVPSIEKTCRVSRNFSMPFMCIKTQNETIFSISAFLSNVLSVSGPGPG